MENTTPKMNGNAAIVLQKMKRKIANMEIEQAIEIVLELANENILTESDARDNNIEDQRHKQFDACGVVQDFVFNILAQKQAKFTKD